jgi:hypothetical protein
LQAKKKKDMSSEQNFYSIPFVPVIWTGLDDTSLF